MIKSKIDARERALELAVKCFDAQSKFGASNVVGFANVFEQYLIGDAELPETEPSTEEVTKRSLEHILELYKTTSTPTIEYESPLMSTEEVMKTLNVSTVTLYRWEKQGILIPKRIGGTKQFLRADVQSLINNPTAE